MAMTWSVVSPCSQATKVSTASVSIAVAWAVGEGGFALPKLPSLHLDAPAAFSRMGSASSKSL